MFFGGQLPTDDKWTIDLVTNSDILAILRSSTGNAPLTAVSADGKAAGSSLFGWVARPAGGACPSNALPSGAAPATCAYVGLFNTAEENRTLGARLAEVFPSHFGPQAKARGRNRASNASSIESAQLLQRVLR